MRHIRSDAMIKGIAGLNWSILMAIPILSKGFSGGTVIKNPPTNAGDMGSIPGSGKIPWRRKWQSTPVLLLGKSHRQGSLVSYTLWGHKELDMPEHIHILSFSFFSHTSFLINIQAHNASQALTGPKYSGEWSQPPVNRRGIPSSPLALLIVMLPKAHFFWTVVAGWGGEEGEEMAVSYFTCPRIKTIRLKKAWGKILVEVFRSS